MSDSDRDSSAWRRAPSAYLSTRPAHGPIGRPSSLYVGMADGCRLGVDVYLPPGAPGPVPAILVFTSYYRRFALRADAPPGTEASPGVARWRDLFAPRGYALVAVDVRGTGANFGTRNSFRSPREREDYARIAAWVVRQPWSDGRIGATGISYVGAACDFLASSGNPAVRAIAPLSAMWDTYIDHYYPGGLLLSRLAQSYDALMERWITTVETCLARSHISRTRTWRVPRAAEARRAKAAARAEDLAPVIKAIRAQGITSATGIAKALNERRIPRARGGKWQAVQVQRLLRT